MRFTRLLPVLFASAWLLFSAVPASGDGLVELKNGGTELHFGGNGDDASSLSVEFESFVYVVKDDGAPLEAGPGCVQVTFQQANCPSSAVVFVQLGMGGGYDSVDVGFESAIPEHVLIEVREAGVLWGGGDAPLDAVISDDSGSAAMVQGSSSYDNLVIDGPRYDIDGGDKDDQITIINDIPSSPVVGAGSMVTGGAGNDLIDASRSTENLYYGASEGIDILHSSQGNDVINFGQGQDLVFGNGGNDRFYANGVVEPGSELSEVWGGPGDDFFIEFTPGVADVTHFEGGPGVDTVTYLSDSSAKPVKINFDAVADDGAIQFGGQAEGDHFHMSVEQVGAYPQLSETAQLKGNDLIEGSDRPNFLFGHQGKDTLVGNGGNDVLDGGLGADTIEAGVGNDEVRVRGGGIDTVECGVGNDLVIADSSDAVDADCETVEVG